MSEIQIKTEDIIGRVVGYLTVLREGTPFYKVVNLKVRKFRNLICQCKCGNIKEIAFYSISKGSTRSCGCLLKEKVHKTHGMCKTKEYQVWHSMKRRCKSIYGKQYKYYLARGIKVCDRWLASFLYFLEDMGHMPSPKHSLDRINNDLGYFKENCRWVTMKVQNRNRSSNRLIEFNGETKCMAEWAEFYNFAHGVLHTRLLNGWTIEKALTTPVAKKRIPVIDTSTNKKYKSIIECATKLGVNRKVLQDKLSGKRKNNTSFIYLKDYKQTELKQLNLL